ncbi:DUF63 family protein [Natrarchaeobius halalkaliphilus]|uniref:DUF63 family protein n=1 Tax=Natrarchaeobius halalkaliphilus TaxID=1679091 RepID=A0A3N6LUW4_9EURY|nr:DUF63 family protein [Natrarchaeobius halalkaliphilus]RQG91394.1 DUF63 family protein [Natrarchaeobius halalkaliphilus]
MVLPEGFVVPPWYLLVPLLVVFLSAVSLLWTLEPPVTDRTVLAFAPWMMIGAAAHVLYRLEVYPDAIAVLFASPGVYLVTATVGGLVWILGTFLEAAGLQRTAERFLGSVGVVVFAVSVIVVLVVGWEHGAVQPFWPVVAVVVSGLVTALAWLVLGLWFTDVAATTGATGALVVFGHALDGISTAIGYDVLGASEEVPVSRMILEAGGSLPTAEYIGAGWLFVAVKIALAMVVLGLFREYVDADPSQGRFLLALIAALGLGPGVHNVLLFAVA